MLKLVEEDAMPAAMDTAIRRLLCICFPPDAATFGKTRHWHGSAPAYSLVQENGHEVEGHVGVVLRRVCCGAEEASVAGIQNLAVHPEWRGTGLGQLLMGESMEEAHRREVPFGLLFCVPALERFYSSLGWFRVWEQAVMRGVSGEPEGIPGKNICMAKQLGGRSFPKGTINLMGADW